MKIYYIAFFVFLSVTLFIFGVYKYYALDADRNKLINARLNAIKNSDNPGADLELLRNLHGIALFHDNVKYKDLNQWLIQTGIIFDKNFYIKVLIFITIFSAIIYIKSSYDIKFLILGPIISVIIIYLYLARSRNKRIAKFEEQLPDALDIIARSLRAGHPTQIAISLASRECRDPIGSEFGYASDEIRHGLDITSALRNMSDRVGLQDLIFVEAAIAVQSQSGGSLSHIVSNLSKIIRERFKLKQKIAALTSEGRASGLVLTALPILIAAVVGFLNPPYYLDVYKDPLFQKCIMAAVLFLIIGHLWIQNLLKFKY